MDKRRIANGIIWIIWWSLKGSILAGIITKKIKDKKKRDFIVMAFDIAVIIVFIWWAFNERASYVQGYTDTMDKICGEYALAFCPTWQKYKNLTLEDIQKYQTGMEVNFPNTSGNLYCNGTGCGV
jgi:hypothetical protein